MIEDQDDMEENINYDKIFARQTDRNIKGIFHEKYREGNINIAIELYEKNIAENYEGNHPYDRLSIIYRRRKDYKNEIRVLKKGIEVFTNLMISTQRGDVEPKLNRFKERLEKVSKKL